MRLVGTVASFIVLTQGYACQTISTYADIDTGSTALVVKPVNLPAQSPNSATVTLSLRRADGTPIPEVEYTVRAPTCIVTTAGSRVGEDGIGEAHVSNCQVGPAAVAAEIALSALNQPVGKTRYIATYTPGPNGEVPAQTVLSSRIAPVDGNGLPDLNYAGRVVFTSTDANATLPPAYDFGPADLGEAILPGSLTLRTPGVQTVVAKDAATGVTINEDMFVVGPPLKNTLTLNLTAPTHVDAGTPFAITVTGLDGLNEPSASFTGAIGITSSDANATLAQGYTVTSNDAGQKVISNLVLRSAGPQTIDVSVGMAYHSHAVINVQPGPVAALQLALLGPAVAGTVETVTLMAVDAFNNIVTTYAGAVQLSDSDPNTNLMPWTLFQPSDAGRVRLLILFGSAGRQSLSAVDTHDSTITGQLSNIDVAPGPVAKLALTTQGVWTAGVAMQVTLTAQDALANPVTDFADTISVDSDDPNAVMPMLQTFSGAHGTITVPVTLMRAGTTFLTLRDINGTLPTEQFAVAVTPGVAIQMRMNGPATTVAGTVNSLTLTVYDDAGNVATSFADTVQVWASDSHAGSVSVAFTSAAAGRQNVALTLLAAGNQNIYASDIQNPNLQASLINIPVAPAPAFGLTLSTPSTLMACALTPNIIVTALDPYGNVASSSTNNVMLHSSDANAIIPSPSALEQGQAVVVGFMPYHVGPQTLTASDNTNTLVPATSVISVTAGTAAVMHWSALSATQVAGSAQSPNLTVFDACGNVATAYAGSVHVSVSDGNAVVPADYPFTTSDAGVHAYGPALILKTAGSQVLQVYDTMQPSVAGQANVLVTAAPTARFSLTGLPTTQTAGISMSPMIQAFDSFGNPTPSYAGTVVVVSSDANASLPQHTFVPATDGGTYVFAGQLKLVTAGTQSVDVVDNGNALIHAGNTNVLVIGNVESSFKIAGVDGGVTWGVPLPVTVTAVDAYGNTQPNYIGVARVTSSDSGATLSPNELTFGNGDQGVKTLTVTLSLPGVQTLTVQDENTLAMQGNQTGRVDRARFLSAGSSGDHHCVALSNSNNVFCWGANNIGALGLGDTTNRGDRPATVGFAVQPVSLGTHRIAMALATGYFFTCALLDNQQVKCWGYNNGNAAGELGMGDAQDRGNAAGEMGDALPTVALGTQRSAVSVAAGSNHACAILDNGQLKCWGGNAYGDLGLGDVFTRGMGNYQMGDYLPAVNLGTSRTAIAVSLGGYLAYYQNSREHTCAVLDNQQVKCWGDNSYGELGLGDTQVRGIGPPQMGDALPYVNLGTGRTALAVGLGNVFACALLDNHQVKCWGSGGAALGMGDTVTRGTTPTSMGDSLPYVSLGTGRFVTRMAVGNTHVCVVLDNNALKCWGSNSFGQLGYGDVSDRGSTPTSMGDNLPAINLGSGRTVVDLDAQYGNTCVILDTRQVLCWGGNGSGQLGLGDTTQRTAPTTPARVW